MAISPALAKHVQGLREAKAAFQAMPDAARLRLLSATEMTVREIARGAKQRLQSSPSVRTRALLNHVVWTINKKNGRGRVGISAGSTTIRNPQMGGIGRNTRKIKGIVVRSARGGARLDMPSRRAHFVEFGTQEMKAEPFMIPATEAEQQPYLSRCKGIGRLLEQDVAKIGGGAAPAGGGRLL